MKKLLIAAVLACTVTLGGCAGEMAKIQTTVSNAIGVIGNARIDSKSTYIAINAFNAAEQAVTAYLRLPRCNGTTPVCRFNGAAAALEAPFRSAIHARNDLRAWMKAHPGSLADAGLYNALKAATSTLQKVMDDYGVRTSGG
jgi:hypothetical protein